MASTIKSRVIHHPERIFSGSPGFVKTLVSSNATTELNESKGFCETYNIANLKELQDHLESTSPSAFERFYIVSQATSWSGLNVSWTLMERILHAYGIGESVFDLLMSFESRLSDTHKLRWASCQSRASVASEPYLGYDLCYRIQYPVPNGRSNCDPYSVRQTGVYQKCVGSDNAGVWILLRPTAFVQERLMSALLAEHSKSDNGRNTSDPMALHLVFLSTLGDFWDEYIEFLRTQLDEYSEPACYSRVGEHFDFPNSDYKVTFTDSQNLELFQWKMSRLSSVLEGNIDVLDMCRDRWQSFSDRTPRIEDSLRELMNIQRQLAFHQRNVWRLAERAQATARLLHRILEFRHDERVDEVTSAMHRTNTKSSETLTRLSDETEALTDLSKTREKDSKMVKALTAIGTVYLPATLVATIFSSNLVQLLPADAANQPVRFAPAPQSWIPIMMAVLLMVFTYGGVKLFEWVFISTRRSLHTAPV